MSARTCGFATAMLIGLFLSCIPAHGGLDMDLGAAMRIGDDAELYLAISSRYFDQDRAEVQRLGMHFDNPDDLAVCLFIAGHAGRASDNVYSLRRGGMSWWEISRRLGLRADIWFVAVQHDPGPPYGKAYGYLNKQRKNRRHAWRLTDKEIRDLVAVRMLHEYYGMPVEAAMDIRASGRNLRLLMTEEYARRHRKGHEKMHEGGRAGKKNR